MSETRVGDWIQTYTGVIFYPLDPRPEEIRIEDIAHALSHQCRFAGHCRWFYSVAQHSVLVSEACPPEVALWGLLHDAAEAYLVDLPRPIKRYCEMGRLYREAESRLMLAVCERFGLHSEMPASVDHADTVLLVTEKRDLMTAEPKPWEDTAEPLSSVIVPWGPRHSKQIFLERYAALGPSAVFASEAEPNIAIGVETPARAANSTTVATSASRSTTEDCSNSNKAETE